MFNFIIEKSTNDFPETLKLIVNKPKYNIESKKKRNSLAQCKKKKWFKNCVSSTK